MTTHRPEENPMTVPIPDPDNLPGPLELEARGAHAAALRGDRPHLTVAELCAAWDDLPPSTRRLYLDRAKAAFDARLAEPGRPDTPETLAARVGMTPQQLADWPETRREPLDEQLAELEDPHHRAARRLTDGERAVLDDIRARNRRRAERRGQLDLGGAA